LTVDSVKKIEVSNIEWGSYLNNIANTLSLKDSIWMKNKPIKTIHVPSYGSGYSCEFDIFVHEKNEKLEVLIENMLQISKKEIKSNFEQIEKMEGMKVVVISFCTC
jgi:3-hydroxy-3-methylglutaryl CoA synthase